MEKIFKNELKRKFFHFLGIIPIFIYSFLSTSSKQEGLVFLFLCLCVALFLDYFRVEYSKKTFLDIREKEKFNFHAATFFLIGAIIVFSIFSYKIALASMYILIFGDLVSTLVGMKFGKKKLIGNKSLVGSLAGFIVSLLVCYLILTNFIFAFFMALSFIFIDLFVNKLEDNLLIPILSSIVGSLVSFILGVNL